MNKTKSSESDVETLSFPSSLLNKKTGISIDFGGSCIKIAYAVREPIIKDETVEFRMVSFASSNLDDALTFLKSRLDEMDKHDENIFTTGVGCHVYRDLISSRLGIQLTIVSEMDCFVEAFRFLVSNFTVSEIAYPPSEAVTAFKDRMLEKYRAAFKGMKADQTDQEQFGIENTDSTLIQEQIRREENGISTERRTEGQLPVADGDGGQIPAVSEEPDEKEVFPCILTMLGSGGGIIKVEKTGFKVMDGMTRCGRMFLGLGSILLGCKSFDELVDLAAQGKDENVTVIAKHLKADDAESDIYSMMPDEMVLYCFGHAVGRNLDDFRKEDIGAALLSTIAQDLAQSLHLNALCLQTKTVFCCGSFVGRSQLVRDAIERYFTLRTSLDRLYNKRQFTQLYFLRYGGYLGVIGSLIRNLNRSS